MCLSNQCPQCGYEPSANEFTDSPPSASELSSEPMDEAYIIHRKARQLETAIERLSQERANLLRKLNQVQSTTRTLPVEILTTIFSHACSLPSSKSSNPSKATSHFQVILGAVSSHWREVAWSTPGLWTTVALNVRPATVQHDTTLLALYLRNSSGYSIYLDLDFVVDYKLGHGPNVDPKRLLERLKPFRNLLFSVNPEKVRGLKLDGMPFKWMPLLPHRFTRIEELLLGWWPGQKLGPAPNPETIELGSLPYLRQVTIKRVMPQIVLPWDQITSLTCHRLPIDVCLHLLTLCPNLVEYGNQFPTAPNSSNSIDLDDVLNDDRHTTLQHLSLLEWSYYPSTICQKLQYLELPALKKLSWTDGGQYQTALPALRGLLQHAPLIDSLTLNSTRTQTAMQDVVKWRDLFMARTRHLTQLRMNSIPPSLLVILSPGPIPSRGAFPDPSGLHSLVLPDLEYLGLYVTRNFDRDLARLDNSPLVGMLENRRAASSSFGEFYLEIDKPVEWSEGIRGRLLNLVQGGLKLAIIENSKMVNWL